MPYFCFYHFFQSCLSFLLHFIRRFRFFHPSSVQPILCFVFSHTSHPFAFSFCLSSFRTTPKSHISVRSSVPSPSAPHIIHKKSHLCTQFRSTIKCSTHNTQIKLLMTDTSYCLQWKFRWAMEGNRRGQQTCCWLSSDMWCHVVWLLVTISDEPLASIFRTQRPWVWHQSPENYNLYTPFFTYFFILVSPCIFTIHCLKHQQNALHFYFYYVLIDPYICFGLM
jgi:hypothetical protein